MEISASRLALCQHGRALVELVVQVSPVSKVLERSRHAVDQELVTCPLGLKPGQEWDGDAVMISKFLYLTFFKMISSINLNVFLCFALVHKQSDTGTWNFLIKLPVTLWNDFISRWPNEMVLTPQTQLTGSLGFHFYLCAFCNQRRLSVGLTRVTYKMLGWKFSYYCKAWTSPVPNMKIHNLSNHWLIVKVIMSCKVWRGISKFS